MDIVIAAAGKGTRLGEYTQTKPKHVLPVAGRPFLYYLLDAIVAAQFRRIIIVGGYQFEVLQESLAAYKCDTEIIVINQHDKVGPEKYGTACALLAAREAIQGDRFVYTNGDHLINTSDLEMMQMSTSEWLLAAYEHDQPERFGVVLEGDDHRLRMIAEKPAQPTSHLINIGLYCLSKSIFPVLERLPSSQRGEYEITDALNQLAEREFIRVVRLQHPWLDLSRPEDLAGLEHFIAKAVV